MITLCKIQLWRIFAEIYPNLNCRLPESATQVSVGVVAGPSNKKPAANCQNRYPSPSKRSDQFLVRPLNLSGIRRRIAQIRAVSKKTFANMGRFGACESIDNYGKGLRACKINYGQWQLPGFWHWRPVVIQRLSRAFWAPGLVQVLQSFLAETRQQALLLVGQVIFFIARTTRHSANLAIIARTPGCGTRIDGHRGYAPVAVFRLASCGHGSAHQFKIGMTQCSRKS